MSGSTSIKSITLKIDCPENMINALESLNNLAYEKLKENKIVFKVTEGQKNEILSFVIEFKNRGSIDNSVMHLDIESVSGKPIHVEWRFSRGNVLRETGYKNTTSFVEIANKNIPPTFPAYLVTITENFQSKYYYITRDNYSFIVFGDKNAFWIKSTNLMRPSFTKSFQIGNILSFNSRPAMVVQVNKENKQLKLTGSPELISFNNPQIKALSKPGKALFSTALSKDGKFIQISNINKSMLLSPPPSRPPITVFEGIFPPDSIDNDVFFANECNKYHGMHICLLNLISMYDDCSKESKTYCGLLTLPFNMEGVSDFSQFLWENSMFDLLECSNALFYPICAGRSSVYESRPHIFNVSGLSPEKDTIEDSKLFHALYLNPSLMEAHRLILNNKFMLTKTQNIIQQSKFLSNELEYLIFIILEKITNFMLLNNILINEKFLFSDKINVNLGSICNKNYRSLTMDGEFLSCRLHSPSFLDEVDLQELADEYSGDIETIENNPLLEYAEYSQAVTLTGRNLEKLSEKLLLRFCNLYSLELRNMYKIDHLPESFYAIKGLQKLTISRLKIVNLPKIWKFPNLKYLSISFCPISNSESEVNMSRLTSVRLYSLPLRTCPEFLFHGFQLTYLEIKLNGLQNLPKELGHLQSLKELRILGSNLYYNLFAEKIESNVKLDEEFLYEYPEVSSFQLGDVGKNVTSVISPIDAFINVPRLGSGYSSSLDNINSGGFPMAILQLTNLTSLCINYQSIRYIPKEIQYLKSLENIDFSFNHLLESIPEEIHNITSIKKITLMHCPALTVPPIEVISRGSVAILAYLKYLLAKKVSCNRTKLMFVGLGEAGKTSLLYALMSPTNEAKTLIEDQNKNVTDGINIDKYYVELPNEENIQFSTWDFAGQDVYYNTHQFFLSSKAIYIVVWSVRQGIEHGDLDFWLSSISCHAKDAPIFVVGTRCDQVKASTDSFIVLKQRYSQIVDFHLVDSFSGTGIKALRKKLVEIALGLPYMHQNIPSSILDLEKIILKLRKEKNYITFKEFEEIAIAEGILEKDVKNVLQIIHDFGTIQYFDTELLKTYVVINPQWIVDIMAKVVSVVDRKIVDGIFYHKDMSEIWKDFDSNLHGWMMSLTEEFDLTFPDPTKDRKANIVPCLLSEHEQQIEWPIFTEQANWKYFQINYLFDFLPAGLFNRIQVRLFDFTDTKTIWKYGTYFQKNEHHVLLKRENKSMLTVRAIGVRPVNVLAMLDEVIRNLIRTSFYGVELHMEISCPDCVEYGTPVSNLATKYWSDVCMISSKLIKKAMVKKVEYLQCAELHLNSLKSIKVNTPDTPTPEEFVNDLYSKVQTVKGLYASSEKVVVMIHSTKDFAEGCVLKNEKIEGIFEKYNLTCKRINESCLTKWKTTISNCCLCLIILSEDFLKISEMNDVLDYIKLLKKTFLLVITSQDPQIRSTWAHGPYFNAVHIKMSASSDDIQNKKYEELADAIKKLCLDILKPTIDSYECFISYCWSNSQDAVNKGTKLTPGAITCEEADPRRLCKYLQKNGVSCWIDDNNLVNNMGLSTQLSRALQDSKMMIAFVSKEYDNSDNCKMELRYMLEVLKRPVVYVYLNNNFDNFINSEVLLLMQKGDLSGTLDFSSIHSISEENLLETVRKTLLKCPKSIKKREEAENAYIFTALNEQVELIFRQFLNQLIIYSQEHCPRLVVLDIEESSEIVQPDSYSTGIELRVICENEGGWHIVDDSYHIDDQEKDVLIENCAVYLYLMYQVLEYKNPGLKCLQKNVINNNDLISKITQIARSSEMSLMESYQNLIKFYMKFDPELDKCSLKRYRMASGRESWMCDKDAAGINRCKRIERDATTQESRISPLDECDKEILKQLKSKMSEEEKKYKESFSKTMENLIRDFKSIESIKTDASQPSLTLLRHNTMLLTEKDIVTNSEEQSLVVSIEPLNIKKDVDVSESQQTKNTKMKPLLSRRKPSTVARQNIVGSRFCVIQ